MIIVLTLSILRWLASIPDNNLDDEMVRVVEKELIGVSSAHLTLKINHDCVQYKKATKERQKGKEDPSHTVERLTGSTTWAKFSLRADFLTTLFVFNECNL